ncbi:MAG: hypothetical protein LBO63_05355 [Oscillospiraceae bacterium]|jgi:uncharacterized protein YsxB (DUF464 family)|nr:hypothetical protein [Oscillospiraceae bacterium]
MTWIIAVCAAVSAVCIAVFAVLRAHYKKRLRDIDGFVGVYDAEEDSEE